jgi:hypothetical protein
MPLRRRACQACHAGSTHAVRGAAG